MTNHKNILSQITLPQVKAEQCKRRLFYFVKEFWSTCNTNPYEDNWHIEYLCDEIQLVLDKFVLNRPPHISNDKWYAGITETVKKEVIINVPPGTSKSTIMSRMAPAWLWCNDDSKTVISNTIDYKNATEFATTTRDIIQSEKYKSYFPTVKIRRDVSAKTFYQSENGGRRYSLTTKGSKTGKHADALFDDDPMDYENAQSPAERKSCIEGFKALQTRKKDKSKVPYILVMQRLSSKDTSAHALSVFKDAKHICLPAEDLHDNINPVGLKKYYKNGLLDPNRLSKEILMQQKAGLLDDTLPISDIAYNHQFNQASQSEDGLMYQINKVVSLPESRDGAIRMSFTDVADTGSDNFATWFCEINQNKIYVFDAIYTQEGSGITSKKLKTKIEQHGSVVNKIEVNNQGSVFVTLMSHLGMNVSGYYSSGNKDERISAYSQFVSLLHFVEPNENSSPEYRAAFKHLESYPKQGKHDDGKDDAEDALTELIRYLYTNYRHLFAIVQNGNQN